MTGARATIDGIPVTADPDTTVLQAARAAGIYIPTLCDHHAVSPFGACRLCLVEVEGSPKLLTACTTPITDGAVIHTTTPRVIGARKAVLELILARHPLECEGCPNEGACELQKIARELGVETSPFADEGAPRTHEGIEDANPFYTRDLDKCILCGRCVRVCREQAIRRAIVFCGRGRETSVGLPDESGCDLCGQCVQVCPAGALMEKTFVDTGRPADAKSVRTICPHCSVGCELVVNVDEASGKISNVTTDYSRSTSLYRGRSWVKGRFAWRFVHREERLTVPLLKEGGAFRRASWSEALLLVADRLGEIKNAHGPGALGFLASHHCTNEENYLMQRLAREVVGTDNIDLGSSVHSDTASSLLITLPACGAMTNDFQSITESDVILVIGADPTENQPVAGTFTKERFAGGECALLVCDPRRTELARCSTIHARQRLGSETALLNGMMNVIIDEGLYDHEAVSSAAEGFYELRKTVESYTPDAVSTITGLPAQVVRELARIYARGPNSAVFFTPVATRHIDSFKTLLATYNLSLLCGMYGRAGTGVNPLTGKGNRQGAIDAGCMPGLAPGLRKISTDLIPETPGLGAGEMLQAAVDGKLAGMYIMGANPLGTDFPDAAARALNSLEFLVVQDLFLTETAELADVILPAAGWGEKDGTFTNVCRSVQRLRKAVEPPGEALPDWEIIQRIARRMGAGWGAYGSPESIFDEMRLLNPHYAGIAYEQLDEGPLSWPCPVPGHPGTPLLPSLNLEGGKTRFYSCEWSPPDVWPTERFPFVALSDSPFLDGRAESMMYRDVTGEFVKDPVIGINPYDAADLGVRSGERIKVASAGVEFFGDAKLSDSVPSGTVRLPNHHKFGHDTGMLELGAVRLERTV